MSRHTDFIRNEIATWGEVHLTIPKEDLEEVKVIASENKAILKMSNQTDNTVKVVLKNHGLQNN